MPEPILRWAHGDAGGRIDLGPLSRDGIEQLLSTVLGAPIEPRSATRLHQASGGTIAESTSSARDFAGTFLAYVLSVHLGRHEPALAILDRVEPHLTAEDRWHAREIRVITIERTAHVDDAIAARDDLLAEAPAHRRDRILAASSNVIATMVAAGHASAALTESHETLEAMERVWRAKAQPVSPLRMHNFTAIAETDLGRLGDAAKSARIAIDGCVAARDEQGGLTATLRLGHLAFLHGRVHDALNRLRQASGLAVSLADEGTHAWALGGIAHALAFAADANGAAAAVAELDGVTYVEPTLAGEFCDRGRAWALAAAGRRTDALTALQAGVERCRERRYRTVEASLLHDIARLGRADGTLDRLTTLVAETDSVLAPLRLAHARALAAGDGDELLRA